MSNTPLNDYLSQKDADFTFEIIGDDCLDYPLPVRLKHRRLDGYLIGAARSVSRKGFQVLFCTAECPALLPEPSTVSFRVDSEAYPGEAVDWDALYVTKLRSYGIFPGTIAHRSPATAEGR